MNSITDGSFNLSIIEALTFHASFSSGENKPILITGVDENGNKGDYVVKLKGAKRMSPEASMRELLAAIIATQMGIQVARPVIVNISIAFVDILEGQDSWQDASNSIGLNFGTEYLRDFTTILPSQELSFHQIPFAQTIFPFDITIHNPDRTNKKPNMMTDGKKIVIYDHELAFSFVLNIFPNLKPWEVQQADMEWINRHILLPKIKGMAFDFDEFSNRFNNLDENFWKAAKELIPQEWLSEQFDKVKQHFVEICNNKEAFIMELKKLMS